MIICKSADEIRLMREAGRIVAKVFLKIEEIIKPGITTDYIDKIAEEIITGEKAVPAFKGYVGKVGKKPFPSNVCISIDEQVVHGIPGKRVIKDGELVSIDIGVKIDGFYGDATRTYKVGNVSKIAERLWNATKDALDESIELCVVGNRLSDVSNKIETRAKVDGFSVVKDFVGHGIGREMHEEPQILNYGPPGQGPVLKPGMVLAIEPMFNQGSSDVEILADLWTVVTSDRKLSCHFEDTVAVLENGPLILTRI